MVQFEIRFTAADGEERREIRRERIEFLFSLRPLCVLCVFAVNDPAKNSLAAFKLDQYWKSRPYPRRRRTSSRYERLRVSVWPLASVSM